MKRFLILLLSLLLPLILPAQDKLETKLDEYVKSMRGMSTEVQSEECDFIISNCLEESIKQQVTFYLYNHYLKSEIMGDDAVAVHIADRWILSGKVPSHSEIEKIQIRLFADFNRSSLIGSQAPEITLRDIYGAPQSPLSGEGFKVLYFYDTGCASCSVESVRLNQYVLRNKYPVKFFAVYTGSDVKAWKEYSSSKLTAASFIHLYDPDAEADFQMKYGVISTPKMFLIDPGGRIVGRGLDTPALEILLDDEFGPAKSYVYGSAESRALFDSLLSLYEKPSVKDILDIAEYIAEDKHLTGDYFYYLSGHHGENYREAALSFIDRSILGSNLFDTAEDTLSVIEPARLMRSLLEKAPLGTKVPPLRLHGTLKQRKALFRRPSRDGDFRLDRLRGKPSYLILYSPSCGSCVNLMESACKLASSLKGVKVLLVDMDRLQSDFPSEASAALEAFDLSVLPYAAAIDRKGIIIRRYIDNF